MIDKRRIAHSFGQNAHQYTHQAKAQEMIAQHLTHLVAQRPIPQPCTILEIGCGTGLLTHQVELLLHPTRYTLNDLSPEMHPFVADIPNSEFVCGDAESTSFCGVYDLIVSSSTLQWFAHPAHFLARMASHLKCGGTLAISTFAPNNLTEISTLTGNTLPYLLPEAYPPMLESYFQIEQIEQQEIVLHFESPRAVLAHLKQTGVNALNAPTLSVAATKHLLADYHRLYQTPKGVTLTYRPLYIMATRRYIPHNCKL